MRSSHEPILIFLGFYTAENKFGIDIPSGQARRACELALGMEFIELRGISHHIGWTVYGIPYDKNLDLLRQGTVQFSGRTIKDECHEY